MLINDKVDAVFIPDSPSRIKATDYNQIKNEIQECITEAGLTPTKDVIQLPQALKILTAQSGAEEVAKIEAAGQEQLDAINTAGAQAVQDAQDAANTATAKATEAASSANTATSKAAEATTQATNAAGSAELAQKWAVKMDGAVAQGQGYGAQKYAQDAASSASSAAASATAAAAAADQAADKAQTDLSNVSQLSQSRVDTIMPANMDYVVESGSSGSTWYRKYKSGWIEQGGSVYVAQDTSAQVNLLKPFSNGNYFVAPTYIHAAIPVHAEISIANRTTTKFTMYCYCIAGDKLWYACGQGA